jgi:hypothetical protein
MACAIGGIADYDSSVYGAALVRRRTLRLDLLGGLAYEAYFPGRAGRGSHSRPLAERERRWCCGILLGLGPGLRRWRTEHHRHQYRDGANGLSSSQAIAPDLLPRGAPNRSDSRRLRPETRNSWVSSKGLALHGPMRPVHEQPSGTVCSPRSARHAQHPVRRERHRPRLSSSQGARGSSKLRGLGAVCEPERLELLGAPVRRAFLNRTDSLAREARTPSGAEVESVAAVRTASQRSRAGAGHVPDAATVDEGTELKIEGPTITDDVDARRGRLHTEGAGRAQDCDRDRNDQQAPSIAPHQANLAPTDVEQPRENRIRPTRECGLAKSGHLPMM